ncbi:MAG: efflux RND transporter periplasmic adaptor subunit [Succiniclasticum sp.]|jgi:multidrug efflux system membrane fusion protein
MKLPEIQMTRNRWLVVAAAAALFVAWRIYAALFPTLGEGRQDPVVRTVTVGSTATEDVEIYPGEVRGKYESNLAFQVGGKIAARYVNVGDRVQAGQVLLELDPKDVRQTLNAAQAAYQSALSNYKLARDNNRRYSSLFAQGAVSTMTRDQYRTQFEAAESSLKSAEANLASAQNQMGYTKLVADHDGTISSLSAEIGQVVAAGTTIATLVESGNREIQIYVPENRLQEVSPGMDATVTFWALPNVTAHGTVTEIASMADSVTRTYRVRVSVPEWPAEARLGMTAKVSLSTGKGSAIVIPSSAIYQTGDQPQVWLVKDGKAVKTKVTIGGYEGSNVRITSGLSKGDVVVTGGTNKIAEGEKVQLEGEEFK